MGHQLVITSHYSLSKASNISTMNAAGKEIYPFLLDKTADKKLPWFGSSVEKSHCTLWTKKMQPTLRSQGFYSIVTIMTGKFPIVVSVVANKLVSDEGQAWMKYKNQHRTQNRLSQKFMYGGEQRAGKNDPRWKWGTRCTKERCLFPNWHSALRRPDMVPPAAPSRNQFHPNYLTDAGPAYS